MPRSVGTATATLLLDTRRAEASYRRFEQYIAKGRGRDNLFSSISADAKDFENSLGKATNRVVAFGAAAAVFSTLAKSATEFARSIIEVDNSLAKINVNLGQSKEGLKQFGSELFNIARQTGKTFEETAKAAEELARQGLGAQETTKRLKDALILSRIAGLDSAEAVETLTAAINSFNESALTSTEVVNKFAAVDTKFAVSSSDLAQAISRVGSTAQSAGVGINELIGLVTSLQQTTARGGSTIGNGLKTIFTRIQAAPETVAALEGIGVAIKNTDGSLRDAISILRDYGTAREKVSEVERASLDRTIAGTFQINILKAALTDLSKQYSVYDNAVKTANEATDEAIRKNEQLNETLASLINSTSLSIKQFFANIGNEKIGPMLKTLLTVFEKVRQFFSGDSGNELGKSLGQGLLQGISNVLSGPALGALFLIIGSAFKKVLTTIVTEAQTLLSINNAAQTRANIQKQIVYLLQQANQQERIAIANATTILAQQQALLSIRERLNREALIGDPLTNSFQVAGRLGLGTRINPKLGRGNIGNFANPLGEAIAREKAAGVPANQIYVDRDPRVATFANPLGLLVANRRDEPLGGYQGVNRVISQGGNPKLSGTTPNFAAPLKSQKDIILGALGLKKDYSGKALSSIDLAMQATEQVAKQAKIFKEASKQLNEAFKPLLEAAQKAESIKNKNFKKAAENLNESFKPLLFAAQQAESIKNAKVVTDQTRKVPYQIPTGGGFDTSRSIMDKNLSNSKNKKSLSNVPIGPKYVTTGQVFPTAASANANLGQGQIVKQTGKSTFQIFAQAPARATQMYSASNPAGPAFPINPALLSQMQARGQAIRFANANINPTSQQYGAPIGPPTRYQSLANAVKRGAEKRRIMQAKLADRRQRIQNGTLAGAFALPLVAGFADNAIEGAGFSTKGGTGGGILSGAISYGANAAGVGALTGNPVIAGVAGAVGALVGAFTKLRKSTQELADEADVAQQKRNDETEALQRAVAIQEQLNEAKKTGESEDVITKLENELRGARSRIPTERKREVLSITDSSEQQKRIGELIRQDEKDSARENIGLLLQKGDFSDKLANEIKTAIEDADINLVKDDSLAKIAATNFYPASIQSLANRPAGELTPEDFAAREEELRKFKEAVEKLSVFTEKVGIKKEDITTDNISKIAGAIYQGVGNKANDKRLTPVEKKNPFGPALPRNAFLSQGNLDVYRTGAATQLMASANRPQKAQAKFDLFTELINNGALNEKAIEGNSEYKKSKAEVQVNNALASAASFLRGNNPGVGRLTNARGEYSMSAINTSLGFVKGANSGVAGTFLDIVKKARATQEEAKIKNIGFREGSGLLKDAVSGFEPGADYGKFASSLKRGGSNYIDKSTVQQTIEAAKYHRGLFKPKFITMDELFKRNTALDDSFGGSGPVLRKEVPVVKTEKTQSTKEQPKVGDEKKEIAVSVNIDGALNLIAQGMPADLSVQINTAINQAIVATTAKYFESLQPQLNSLSAQVAAINGKPLPPIPETSPNPMKSINRIFGATGPTLPAVNTK